MALKKQIFFRDDLNKCTDANLYYLNLKIFIGLTKKRDEEFIDPLNDMYSNE